MKFLLMIFNIILRKRFDILVYSTIGLAIERP